jgi:lysozyme family protein
MQSSYDRALAAVLEHEGGYVDHPKDPGGATNKGITLANFRRYVKADGTKADLKRLTTAQAAAVYRHQYWAPVSADVLPAGVDYAVFDFGVNSGPSRAIKFLQRVVGVKQDGRIGPKTLAAVAAMPPLKLINKLCETRLIWLTSLKTWETFGKGWTKRISGVRALAQELAGEVVVDTIIKEGVEEALKEPETVTVTTPTGTPEIVIKDPPPTMNRLLIVLGSIVAAIVAGIVSFFQQGGQNGF